MRNVALGAALLGGIGLVANLFVDVDALAWAGRVLLALAVAVAGSALVREAWLRAVCAVGAVALAGSVLAALVEVGPRLEVEAVVGGLATLVVAALVVRPAPARPARPARPGNHRH